MTASILSLLQDMFPHTIVVTPRTFDNEGTPSEGTPVSRRGRVSGQRTMVRDDDGEEIMSSLHVCFADVQGVSVNDKYELPAGFEPRTPEAVAVSQTPDENGVHHEKVFF